MAAVPACGGYKLPTEPWRCMRRLAEDASRLMRALMPIVRRRHDTLGVSCSCGHWVSASADGGGASMRSAGYGGRPSCAAAKGLQVAAP